MEVLLCPKTQTCYLDLIYIVFLLIFFLNFTIDICLIKNLTSLFLGFAFNEITPISWTRS